MLLWYLLQTSHPAKSSHHFGVQGFRSTSPHVHEWDTGTELLSCIDGNAYCSANAWTIDSQGWHSSTRKLQHDHIGLALGSPAPSSFFKADFKGLAFPAWGKYFVRGFSLLLKKNVIEGANALWNELTGQDIGLWGCRKRENLWKREGCWGKG